ncbi:hypothetical protein M406DRAFT_324626 [Cryphonectria parasitica EP155]|uniref:Uncharacterized protein n=1 Tax=Cryphonectria parasitica (strain ATCC 38755 / EP155) TaxID=660469 RepID=A0A9P4XUC4_CRYP1|nr:uncharacterized protein M406DRAFT_324626 [Cryphonectria parasitica EP155]KAF3761071.1 hypothetical protein M406DRAFT_324626 [Cryphonectria parasitica EP155]
MPPKRVIVERGYGSGKRIQKGYFASTYETLTSPENSAMVKAIASFGVGVAFLSTSWGEFLLPPQ